MTNKLFWNSINHERLSTHLDWSVYYGFWYWSNAIEKEQCKETKAKYQRNSKDRQHKSKRTSNNKQPTIQKNKGRGISLKSGSELMSFERLAAPAPLVVHVV